jgi:hypothetical protein
LRTVHAPADVDAAIAVELRDPTQSDHAIAHAVGCDRRRVARVRRALEAAGNIRHVPPRDRGVHAAPGPIATPEDVRAVLAEYRRAGLPFGRAWSVVRTRVDGDLGVALAATRSSWCAGYERRELPVAGSAALGAWSARAE